MSRPPLQAQVTRPGRVITGRGQAAGQGTTPDRSNQRQEEDEFLEADKWQLYFTNWRDSILELVGPPRPGRAAEIEIRYSDYPSEERVPPGVNGRINPRNFERLQQQLPQSGWTLVDTQTSISQRFNDPGGLIRLVDQKLQRKDRLGLVVSRLGFEVSRALEQDLPALPPGVLVDPSSRLTRIRTRFRQGDLAELTLTEVRRGLLPELPGVLRLGQESVLYQMEMELLPLPGGDAGKRWEAFRLLNFSVLMLLRAGIPVPLRKRLAVLDEVNLCLSEATASTKPARNGRLDPDLISKPVNLHMSDLSWGRIFGHSDPDYSYAVTPKADGERLLLYVRQEGAVGELWALGAPDEARLLLSTDSYVQTVPEAQAQTRWDNFRRDLEDFFRRYNGSILDGELIPPENWRTPLPDVGFVEDTHIPAQPEIAAVLSKLQAPTRAGTQWFLAFDLLRNGKGSLTENLFETRQTALGELVRDYQALRLGRPGYIPVQIDWKQHLILGAPTPFKSVGQRRRYDADRSGFGYYSYFRERDPAQFFFTRMQEMVSQLGLDGNQRLAYATDGLIFTPRGRYDPMLPENKLVKPRRPVRERRQPLKWKLLTDMTIDLAVTHSPGRVTLEARSFGRSVPFDRYQLQSEQPAEFWTIPPGGVAEFELRPGPAEEDPPTLRFRRRRRDKEYANDIRTIEDNVKMFFDPVRPETLTGNDLRLHRALLNRLKKELFQLAALPKSAGQRVLLDIGSGHLQDYRKWEAFDLIYAVEPNPKNMEKGQRRLAEAAKSDPRANRVRYIQAYGEDPLEQIPSNSVDCVSLMLSLTFFWEPSGTPIRLQALLRTINRVLKVGGSIILLTMDGNVVDEVFSDYGVGGLYQPPVDPQGQPLQGPDQPDGKDPDIARGDRYPTVQWTVVAPADGRKLVEMRPLENGQLWIDIPGTIVENQIESLVYLHDIPRLARNFSVVKVGRADQELLLTPGQAQFAKFYMWAQLAKGAEEHYIAGGTALTQAQIMAKMQERALSQGPPPPVSSLGLRPSSPTRSVSLTEPLAVVIPQVRSNRAEGDGVTQMLDPDFLVSGELQANPGAPAGAWPGNWPHSIRARPAFPSEPLVRIATIPEAPDNFFHAFLHGTLSQYWNDYRYDSRVNLVNTAKQFVRQVLGTSELLPDLQQKIITYISGQVDYEVQPGLVRQIGDSFYPYWVRYPLPVLLQAFDGYLAGQSELLEPLLPIVAICYKIHLVVFQIVPGGKALAVYSTAVDLLGQKWREYRFPRTLLFLRFPRAGPQKYHYELIGIRDMARGLTLPSFDSNHPSIQALNSDLLSRDDQEIFQLRQGRGLQPLPR